MIQLHKLGHAAEPFYLTPDLIVTVEANPDTVVTLTTGAKLIVVEKPETIVKLVRASRVGVLVDALDQREEERAGEPWTDTRGRGPGQALTADSAAQATIAPPRGPRPPAEGLATRGRSQTAMKPATAVGIGVAAFGILLSAMMEGTSPAAFIDIPALLIVCGGTGGATMASVGMESMKKIPKLYKLVFGPPPIDMQERISMLVSLAEQARREGLLALDSRLSEIDDEFTRKGLQLVVDGTDPELVREILEADIDGMIARHAEGAAPFEKAGGFAPTMGIIGTVMGLVHVLQNLAAPSTLGPAISSAFIATLMGVGSANVIFLPIASRLKALSAIEVELRTLTLDGIIAVQAGDNPRLVADRLNSFIAPIERGHEDEEPATAGGALREAA